MSNLFPIYNLPYFNVYKKDYDKYEIEGTLKEILSKLKEDKRYCLRIDANKTCIVYSDLDHVPINNSNIIKNFFNIVSKRFNVSTDKIQYTFSEKLYTEKQKLTTTK